MVNSFFADPVVGGDGTTTDDGTGATGLDNGGHRLRLVPMFSQMIVILNWVKAWITTQLATMQTLSNSAVNAPGTSATSITNFTPAVGSQAFTLAQTGKAFALGQFVTGYASVNNWFAGQITAFVAGTGAITVNIMVIGSAPAAAASWTVGLTGPIDSSLTGRVTALETLTAKQEARARLFRKELI